MVRRRKARRRRRTCATTCYITSRFPEKFEPFPGLVGPEMEAVHLRSRCNYLSSILVTYNPPHSGEVPFLVNSSPRHGLVGSIRGLLAAFRARGVSVPDHLRVSKPRAARPDPHLRQRDPQFFLDAAPVVVAGRHDADTAWC